MLFGKWLRRSHKDQKWNSRNFLRLNLWDGYLNSESRTFNAVITFMLRQADMSYHESDHRIISSAFGVKIPVPERMFVRWSQKVLWIPRQVLMNFWWFLQRNIALPFICRQKSQAVSCINCMTKASFIHLSSKFTSSISCIIYQLH